MTREERAIQILEQRACCRECVVENCTCVECDEAFEMAIKALEQEPKTVIEDIKAEIEEEADGSVGEFGDGLYYALDIMDKHLADMRGDADGTNNN